MEIARLLHKSNITRHSSKVIIYDFNQKIYTTAYAIKL